MNERDPKQNKAASFVANILAAYRQGNPSNAARMALDLRDILNSMPSPGGRISEGAAACTQLVNSIRTQDKSTAEAALTNLVDLATPWGVQSFLGHLGVSL